MEFNLEEAKKAADEALFLRRHKCLTDVEWIILKGAWQNQTYDEIATQNPHYGSGYISRDAAPSLWNQLSEALGENIKKNNFKKALKRWWEKKLASGQISLTQNMIANQSPKNAVDKFSPQDFYVERPIIESRCYDTLLLPGSLLRIKALRQMGKTSLINRVLAKLENQGYGTVNLSLKLADTRTHFTNLDKFLRWLCSRVSRELKIPSQLDDWSSD